MKWIVRATLCIIGCTRLQAQDIFKEYEHLFTSPRTYVIYKANTALTIDGRLNEASWQKAPWSEEFVDIEGSKKPLPLHKTRFKMIWDQDHLYIAAELEEPHIWGTLTRHDQIIYHDNDFEIFIDPNGDTHNYYEIEVNTLNTIFDLLMPRPYRNGGKVNIRWNVEQLRSAISMEGTNNNPDDIDKKWIVEMAIPFRSLNIDSTERTPVNRTIWNINFSRVQWQTNTVDGKYVKKKDSVTNRNLPEFNWVWSPQGVINMHFPERWGYVLFSDKLAGNNSEKFSLPETYQLKKHLWLIYYKQKEYLRKHKAYADDLQTLNIPDVMQEKSKKTKKISLTRSEKGFVATITNSDNEYWQIDQDGKTQTINSRP